MMNNKKLNKIYTEILNPSCSEQVFKLKGDLEDIKEDVLKMIDICRKDLSKEERIKLEERIKNIKNLEDFELVVFEFTGDYETYFKKENSDLLVATTQHREWGDNIDCFPVCKDEDGEEDIYSKISNQDYYKILFKDEDYLVGKEEYAEGIPKLVFLKNKNIILQNDNTFKLSERKGCFYILSNNSLIEVEEIKDKKLKDKLSILVNLK